MNTRPRLIHRQGLSRILDVAGVGIVESSKRAWRLGVWIDRADVEDLNTDGLAVGVCVRRGGVCDSVGTPVRLGGVAPVPSGGVAVGEEGPATVASAVAVGGVLVPSWPVGEGVRLAVGMAVSVGSGGGCVGPWVGGDFVNARVGSGLVGSVVGGVTTCPVGVMVGMV
jgi:hypothetical protein